MGGFGLLNMGTEMSHMAGFWQQFAWSVLERDKSRKAVVLGISKGQRSCRSPPPPGYAREDSLPLLLSNQWVCMCIHRA